MTDFYGSRRRMVAKDCLGGSHLPLNRIYIETDQ